MIWVNIISAKTKRRQKNPHLWEWGFFGLFLTENSAIVADILVYALEHDMVESASVPDEHEESAFTEYQTRERSFGDDRSSTIGAEDGCVFTEYISGTERIDEVSFDIYID